MTSSANEVLDRLAALLAKVKSGPVVSASGAMSTWDLDAYIALRSAAPALIRLARAASTLAADPRYEYGRVEFNDAIKALGEVRP